MQFSTYIFSADISPEMLKLGRVTKVRMLFLVLVFAFNFDLFKFSAAILEKGLFRASVVKSDFLASLMTPGITSSFQNFIHRYSRKSK